MTRSELRHDDSSGFRDDDIGIRSLSKRKVIRRFLPLLEASGNSEARGTYGRRNGNIQEILSLVFTLHTLGSFCLPLNVSPSLHLHICARFLRATRCPQRGLRWGKVGEVYSSSVFSLEVGAAPICVIFTHIVEFLSSR